MNEAVLADIVARIENSATHLTNEEQTKTHLIVPFIEDVLGYDDSSTLHAEDNTDAPANSQLIDYSCYDKNGNRRIVVECKKMNESFNQKHIKQLNEYFANSVSEIGILTNGKEYRFYCADDNESWMAKEPFFTIDLTNLSELDKKFIELISFCNYDSNKINQFINAITALKSLGISLEYSASAASSQHNIVEQPKNKSERKKTEHIDISTMIDMGKLRAGMKVKFGNSNNEYEYVLSSDGRIERSDGIKQSLSQAATYEKKSKWGENGWLSAFILLDGKWTQLKLVRNEAEKELGFPYSS